MATETESNSASLKLHLIARFALGISIIAAALLGITLLFLASSEDAGYAQLIRSHSVTQQNLGLAVILSALFLISLVGAITWVLAMQGSFRLAGPFYRFSRNFEQASTTSGLLKIRKNDQLQDVCELLRRSNETLHGHYRELSQLLDQVEASLAKGGGKKAAMGELMAKIEEHCTNVRLD